MRFQRCVSCLLQFLEWKFFYILKKSRLNFVHGYAMVGTDEMTYSHFSRLSGCFWVDEVWVCACVQCDNCFWCVILCAINLHSTMLPEYSVLSFSGISICCNVLFHESIKIRLRCCHLPKGVEKTS